MTLLDLNLVARCVESYRAWRPYAGKRNGDDIELPTVPPVDVLLEREGITWDSDRALYYRYERAVRRRVGAKPDMRRAEYRRSA